MTLTHACTQHPPIILRYDGTVRNSSGAVVQFLYGEDGMDGVRVEEQVRRYGSSGGGGWKVCHAPCLPAGCSPAC